VRKFSKYAALLPKHDFSPFIVQTHCVSGLEAASLVYELGRRIAAITGEPRPTYVCFVPPASNSLEVALHRGNSS